jgi:hypothetical protein
MQIMLKKFGTTLTSRQLGKEAFAVLKLQLADLSDNEKLEIDFKGVNTFSPSWGDEFLTPLADAYGDRVVLINTQNLSVKATLKLLENINKKSFVVVS